MFGNEKQKSLIKDLIGDNLNFSDDDALQSYKLLLVDTPKGCSVFFRSFDYESAEDVAIVLFANLKSEYITFGIDEDFDFIRIDMFVGSEYVSEVIFGKDIRSYG